MFVGRTAGALQKSATRYFANFNATTRSARRYSSHFSPSRRPLERAFNHRQAPCLKVLCVSFCLFAFVVVFGFGFETLRARPTLELATRRRNFQCCQRKRATNTTTTMTTHTYSQPVRAPAGMLQIYLFAVFITRRLRVYFSFK